MIARDRLNSASPQVEADRPPRDWWLALVSAIASLLISTPLLVNGTPDVESYTMSIFSTIAFAQRAGWHRPVVRAGLRLRHPAAVVHVADLV